MPILLELRPPHLPPGARRKLTREDCLALEGAGLLERERFELIDGELIRRTGKSRSHTITLLRVMAWLRLVFGTGHVEHEAPIDLTAHLDATNEPEPDAVVLRRPSEEFRTENPGPEDILLAVEVSATTQDYDLGAKAALYAIAGIAEYWVLDVKSRCLVVHLGPTGDHYSSIISYAADEPVSPQAAPMATICARDLLS